MSKHDEDVSVLIADDHTVVRQGLAALINQEPGFRVVAQCPNGRHVLDTMEHLSCDVVIMDLSMPEFNGLEVCTILRQRQIMTPLIVLTMHDEPRLVQQALASGVTGYLTKDAGLHHLLDAIRTVISGGTYLGPGLSTMISSPRGESGDAYQLLTPREREILGLIGGGLSTRDISVQLGISSKTVGTHRVRIMRKLNIHHQVALARYAMERIGQVDALP